MKKVLALLMSLLMVFACASCSSEDSGDGEAEKKTSFAVGETADIDGAKYTVTDVEYSQGDEWDTPTTAEFFPENKGTATSLVMIASSIANYTILSLAGYITKVGGSSAPRMILLLNMAVTIIGILLALFVKKNRNK